MLNSIPTIISKSNAKVLEQHSDYLRFKWKYQGHPYLVIITTEDHVHISISHNNPSKKPKMAAITRLVDICFDGTFQINLNTVGAGLRPNVYHLTEIRPSSMLTFRMKVN